MSFKFPTYHELSNHMLNAQALYFPLYIFDYYICALNFVAKQYMQSTAWI